MTRPKAELLTIGSELLKGTTLNSNALFLGRELTSLGFDVIRQTACLDEIPAISRNLGEAFDRAELIIVTGGLGPTPDDVTREGIADYFDVPLKFSKTQYQLIEKLYKARGKKVPESVYKEALFPANSVPLINRYGIALGFYIRPAGKFIAVLPGVPREQEKMFLRLVVPLAARFFPKVRPKYSLVARTVGLSEPAIMEKLGKSFFRDSFEFGIYPYPGEVTMRIQAERESVIRRLRKMLETRLGKNIYSFQDYPLAEVVGRRLLHHSMSLAVAESCTGGLLSAAIVARPGAARYFKGGFVAYSNHMKISELALSASALKRMGAVSREAALLMAEAARSKTGADAGLSVTGIAGPEGGSARKPVGTVWVGYASGKGKKAWGHTFSGDRIHVQQKSVQFALEHLWRELA